MSISIRAQHCRNNAFLEYSWNQRGGEQVPGRTPGRGGHQLRFAEPNCSTASQAGEFQVCMWGKKKKKEVLGNLSRTRGPTVAGISSTAVILACFFGRVRTPSLSCRCPNSVPANTSAPFPVRNAARAARFTLQALYKLLLPSRSVTSKSCCSFSAGREDSCPR